MLGKLTGEDEADSSLDFARSNSGLLVVAGQVLGLDGDLVKDILQVEILKMMRMTGGRK